MEDENKNSLQTAEQIVDNLTLFDDDLMSMVFDANIEATELLLRIILKKDDIKVLRVIGQKELENPIVSGRNIRLDIYAQDSTEKYYDIEVQRSNEGAHVRRARFHSSMLDVRMLKEGQKFKEIFDSYVIFITENDFVGDGLPLYHVRRMYEETNKTFDDGSHIIYVNGSYKGDDPIGKLIHDFGCKNAKDIYYQELAKGVKHFKEEGGRSVMCQAVEEYANKKAEEEKNVIAVKMIKAGKYALEEIANLTGLTLAEVQKLQKSV